MKRNQLFQQSAQVKQTLGCVEIHRTWSALWWSSACASTGSARSQAGSNCQTRWLNRSGGFVECHRVPKTMCFPYETKRYNPTPLLASMLPNTLSYCDGQLSILHEIKQFSLHHWCHPGLLRDARVRLSQNPEGAHTRGELSTARTKTKHIRLKVVFTMGRKYTAVQPQSQCTAGN
jgi:hypothetical protein